MCTSNAWWSFLAVQTFRNGGLCCKWTVETNVESAMLGKQNLVFAFVYQRLSPGTKHARLATNATATMPSHRHRSRSRSKSRERPRRRSRDRSKDPLDERRSRSPEHQVELPNGASPITEADYFQKSDEFRLWLKEEKRKVSALIRPTRLL